MSHVPLPCIPWCLSSSISTRHSECRSNKSHQRCPSYDGCLVRLTLRPHHWPPMPRAPVECSRPTAGTTTAARRLMCPTSVRSSSTASVAWCRRSSSRDPRSGRACRGACWRHRSTSYDTIEVPGLARCCWLVWLVGWCNSLTVSTTTIVLASTWRHAQVYQCIPASIARDQDPL